MEDQSHRKTYHLPTTLKNKVVQFLLQHYQNGAVTYGVQKEAAETYGTSRRTVSRLWKIAREQMSRGEPVMMIGKVRGYKHKDKLQVNVEKVKTLSVLQRSSLRKMAFQLDVSKSLLGKWVKEKQIKPHSSAIKPTLTELNKLTRLRWCLSQLHPTKVEGQVRFQSMHDVVHIDEKWFYMTKSADRFYLLPDEEEPYRSCKSKRFITKVMFMCAVSRPQFGSEGEIIFDGKVGMFPFTKLEPAKRNSKNRAKGTLETKPIQAITKSVIKDCIIQQIIPAIKAKWPPTASKHIFIQQDNARPHISEHDIDFQAAANSDGFKIQLICQPPNSPDTNVLDLGFFRAIQSLQDDMLAQCVDELVKNVFTSFDELSAQTLNNVFITLQTCLIQIMTVGGGNNYKIPHINKQRLVRTGTLPIVIEVDEEVVKKNLEFLYEPENNIGSGYNIGPLAQAFGY